MILQVHPEELVEVIPLHFNVPEHYLPLDEFIIYANNTKTIINNFNTEFCEGKLQYQILILPPEAGSFKSKIGLCIKAGKAGAAGLAILWAFCESNIGSSYIEGLTGHTPADLAKKVGSRHKEELEKEDQEKTPKHAALIISECTKGFLQKETAELQKIGLSVDKFKTAYQARNEFYQTCQKNKKVQGVGFDDSDSFPIKRSEFPKFIVELPIQQEETETDEESNWLVEQQNITVTSPNWEREDDRHRHWKGKYDGDKIALFTIDDDTFWHKVITQKLQPKIRDNMAVQWAFNLGAQNKRKNLKVLKVLEYNGTKISEPLTDEELSSVLTSFSTPEDTHAQDDLFTYSKGYNYDIA